MTATAILITIAVALGVSEFTELCPWLADQFIRWSARTRYSDPSRAAVRSEELAALLKSRPGNLLKLFTATGFALTAVFHRLGVGLWAAWDRFAPAPGNHHTTTRPRLRPLAALAVAMFIAAAGTYVAIDASTAPSPSTTNLQPHRPAGTPGPPPSRPLP